MARLREKGGPNRSRSLVQLKSGQCTHEQAAGSGSTEQFLLLKKGKGRERLQMLAWLPELPKVETTSCQAQGTQQALVPRAWPLATTTATSASLLQASSPPQTPNQLHHK